MDRQVSGWKSIEGGTPYTERMEKGNRRKKSNAMIYKFDILFKKTLSNGGVKVLTYKSLLENPKAYGGDENLAGAIGELSLVREGTEQGFSLNNLLCKYNSLLVGRHYSEIFRKVFPMQFIFTNPEDVTSVKAQVIDEDGNIYSSKAELTKITGEKTLNLKEVDSGVMIIPVEGTMDLSDEIESNLIVSQGEIVFVMASTNKVVMQSSNAATIHLTLDA